MSDQMPTLFTPTTLGALALPNRIAMAPLTRMRAGAGNAPTPLNAAYYAQRASAGLLISEGSQIRPEGAGYLNTPGIYSSEQVAGWRLVTDAVHAAGGRIVCQLWHVGRISHPELQPEGQLPVSASAIAPTGHARTPHGKRPFVAPRALAPGEIADVVAQFGFAARQARAAGFDGVEIHGANGYLIDQFLRDGSNQRTDGYGGSITNRVRFLREVAEAVCAAWQPARVGVRLSPANRGANMIDSDPAALFGAAAAALRPLDLAFLHLYETSDEARAWTPALGAAFGGPLIVNGGYDRARAIAAVSSGVVEVVAFGQLYIANPDLVERLALDAPLNAPDSATFYGGGVAGYTDYPTLAEQAERV